MCTRNMIILEQSSSLYFHEKNTNNGRTSRPDLPGLASRKDSDLDNCLVVEVNTA